MPGGLDGLEGTRRRDFDAVGRANLEEGLDGVGGRLEDQLLPGTDHPPGPQPVDDPRRQVGERAPGSGAAQDAAETLDRGLVEEVAGRRPQTQRRPGRHDPVVPQPLVLDRAHQRRGDAEAIAFSTWADNEALDPSLFPADTP